MYHYSPDDFMHQNWYKIDKIEFGKVVFDLPWLNLNMTQ